MYWPIAAPKIYAASKQTAHKKTTTTDDGLQDLEPRDASKPSLGSSDLLRSEDNGDHGEETLLQNSEATRKEVAEVEEPEERRQSVQDNHTIVGMKVARSGHLFATITRSSLSIWQTKPTVLLATIARSEHSLNTYGPNVCLLLRPDALIIVVQTQLGYLITYSLATAPNARVYQTQLQHHGGSHARRPSADGIRKFSVAQSDQGPGEGDGIPEVNIRFRMVIRIDAGISKALVVDEELIVATQKPAAVQCIRWSPDRSGSSHSTELLKRMPWLTEKATIVNMIFDRPMNFHAWITGDGDVYAVQRLSGAKADPANPKTLFRGYCFHRAANEDLQAAVTAINARFSLIAVGCADASVQVYTAKDYLGNIPLSHTLRLPVSLLSSGKLEFLSYSPDGYCLFVGFEKGWATWSVYGKPGASSFTADHTLSKVNNEMWLHGAKDGFWVGAGCEIVLLSPHTDQICLLEMARSSATGCYAFANIGRSLIQASTSVMLYRGFDLPDVTAVPGEHSLWQTVQLPLSYLANQWPVRSTVISADGRYVAVAGRRGLAHYSVGSGRWKTFDDYRAENEFTVRGGLCWYQHILVAAVESDNAYQIRLYSREKSLDFTSMLHTEDLQSPVVHLATVGEDSLLVYTYENILFHYIFTPTASSVKLAQVGQIAFHGIIRAPPRVRAITWVLPDEQREHGDPSQDVATAAVLFLVDGKLVLLQPSANEHGELKYDMRVIANNVEYYTLNREQAISSDKSSSGLQQQANGLSLDDHIGHSLRDSLWYFDGSCMRVWPDVMDVLSSAPTELGRELPPAVGVPTDFYPLCPAIDKGILVGVESDLVQRRDVDFAFYRFGSRTHLFIPPLLRHHLAQYDSPAALHLSQSYQTLPYFPHALEILLHSVLDEEVDAPPESLETALLPSVLSFLSSFPSYLDIVVGCARKTELRSWRTLFKYLPPVRELFEESLHRGLLKTAGGYLLVLHTFQEEQFNAQQIARLLRMAREEGDWDLCKELARFLVGIDETGSMLRMALSEAGLGEMEGASNGALTPGRLSAPPSSRRSGTTPTGGTNGNRSNPQSPSYTDSPGGSGRSQRMNGYRGDNAVDYFNLGRGSSSFEEDYKTPVE